MKIILFTLFAFALVPVISESFAEEIKLPFGETVVYDDLKLYFYDIEDSRCPSDVTCIWEGKVSAMIRVSNDTLDIGGPQPIGFVQNSFPPYSILIKDIQPYPVSTEKPDYVAFLQITKSDTNPDDLTDEKICDKEDKLVDGVCIVSNPQPVYGLDCEVLHIWNYAIDDCNFTINSINFIFSLLLPIIAVIAVSTLIVLKYKKRF